MLSTDDIKMAKAFGSPPKYVKITFEAVLHLLAGVHPDVPAKKNGALNVEEGKRWAKAQNIMNNPKDFIENLKGYKAIIDGGKDLN